MTVFLGVSEDFRSRYPTLPWAGYEAYEARGRSVHVSLSDRKSAAILRYAKGRGAGREVLLRPVLEVDVDPLIGEHLGELFGPPERLGATFGCAP